MPTTRLLVSEIHSFGGFFQGDVVTLSGRNWPDKGQEHTLTIDEAVFDNLRDRHTLRTGMVLMLELIGERVDGAWLLAAADHEALRRALGAEVATDHNKLDGPLVLSYYCPTCELWVAGAPDKQGGCILCGNSAL